MTPRSSSTCRGRRASPTAPSSWPALADGESLLTNVPDGDDTAALATGLAHLGVEVVLDGDRAVVQGSGGQLAPAAVPASTPASPARRRGSSPPSPPSPTCRWWSTATPPLRARPMAVLHDRAGDARRPMVPPNRSGQLPVEVTGPLGGGTVALAGDVSSQFITTLMLVGPVLDGGVPRRADDAPRLPPLRRPHRLGDDRLRCRGRVLGAHDRRGAGALPLLGNLPSSRTASSASYPMAVAALRAVPVTVAGLHPPLTQGDGAIVGLLEAMGYTVITDERGTTVTRGASSPLVGIDVDMADVSDLVPTVAVVAAAATTPTTVRGVGFIRSKESDRLGDLAAELTRTAPTSSRPTTACTSSRSLFGALHGARLATHHDHRLAMAFAVLATAIPGIDLDDPSVVSKSWPGFWTVWEQLRA